MQLSNIVCTYIYIYIFLIGGGADCQQTLISCSCYHPKLWSELEAPQPWFPYLFSKAYWNPMIFWYRIFWSPGILYTSLLVKLQTGVFVCMVLEVVDGMYITVYTYVYNCIYKWHCHYNKRFWNCNHMHMSVVGIRSVQTPFAETDHTSILPRWKFTGGFWDEIRWKKGLNCREN